MAYVYSNRDKNLLSGALVVKEGMGPKDSPVQSCTTLDLHNNRFPLILMKTQMTNNHDSYLESSHLTYLSSSHNDPQVTHIHHGLFDRVVLT